MSGKVVGAGGLNRAHLPHIVAGENFELRLMLIDKGGELESYTGCSRPNWAASSIKLSTLPPTP